MEEFNYELARQGKPVCTKGGQPVRIICWDRKGHGDLVIVALVTLCGKETAFYYNKKGENISQQDELTLMMGNGKRKVWMNLYAVDTPIGVLVDLFLTNSDAEEEGKHHDNYITTKEIEWEEK